MALAALLVLSAAAETPDEQRARVQRIEDAVLAPCCYAEPVSRHQSEIAVKMRIEIAKSVAEGKTDGEILGAYANRYGSKVLVDPRTIPRWWTPWVAWLMVISAVVMGFWLVKRWHARARVPALPPPSADAAALPDLEDDE